MTFTLHNSELEQIIQRQNELLSRIELPAATRALLDPNPELTAHMASLSSIYESSSSIALHLNETLSHFASYDFSPVVEAFEKVKPAFDAMQQYTNADLQFICKRLTEAAHLMTSRSEVILNNLNELHKSIAQGIPALNQEDYPEASDEYLEIPEAAVSAITELTKLPTECFEKSSRPGFSKIKTFFVDTILVPFIITAALTLPGEIYGIWCDHQLLVETKSFHDEMLKEERKQTEEVIKQTELLEKYIDDLYNQ